MKCIKIGILRRLFFGFLLLMPLTGHGQENPSREPVVLALTEYTPLMSNALKGYGISPSIVRVAFKKVNIEVAYQFYPPARAFSMAKSGVVAGTVGWVWSKERGASFLYSDPYFEAPLVFFHLKSIPFDWKNYDDLKDLRIGFTLKNYYGPEFHEAMDAGKLLIDKSPTDILQFDKLLYGRIDLVPINFYVGYGFIHSRYDVKTIVRFTHHPRPLKISRYHVLFSKAVAGSNALVKEFNRGLEMLKDSGELHSIVVEHSQPKNE